MKTNQPNKDDAPLRDLLKEWKSQAALPPRFAEQVWRRIEVVEAPPAPSVSLATVFATWIATLLPRPALATAYVAVLLLIGAGVGWTQARNETARITSGLSMRYAEAVNPYHPAPQP
jgi:hypothetical protein